MRTFVALDIDSEIRDRIAGFIAHVRDLAPQVRWVKPDSLHVTLRFLGEQSPAPLENIKQSLCLVPGRTFQLSFRGYGFFPSANSARVFWIGIEAEPQLVALAEAIHGQLHMGEEDRAFNPHLTLARCGSGAPGRLRRDRQNLSFKLLQEKLSSLPALDFGTMSARQFFLYESRLSRDGAQYTKIAHFPLVTEG
jgi:2'-5' RNA ligase